MTSSLRRAGETNHAFNFDVVKSSSTSTMTSSPTSSPSSTISETNNVSIRTKKPRTTRKRPNQTYNEAATLLSKAYPNLFRNFKNKQPGKFIKPVTESNDSSSELLLPFRACDNDAVSFLLQNKSTSPQTESERVFSVREKLCSGENISYGVMKSNKLERHSREDFDCESILNEEIQEGIDSIIGSRVEDVTAAGGERATPWYGGFGGKFGWARALRHVDGGNWWNFATVDVLEISPRMKNTPAASVPATEKKKKRKAKVEVLRDSSQGLRLKLNYDDVRNAWSDRGSPFAGDCCGSGSPEYDLTIRFSSPAGIKKSRRKKFKKENV